MGEILQTPPAFSALKVGANGLTLWRVRVRWWNWPPRTIQIHALDLLEFTGDSAILSATVGKGTYIRTLGTDIATAPAQWGTLPPCARTQHGAFGIENARGLPELLETLDTALKTGQSPDCLHPLPAPVGV